MCVKREGMKLVQSFEKDEVVGIINFNDKMIVATKNAVYEVPDQATPSEALYGFIAWITTRPEIVSAGGNTDCAVWPDLIEKYCKAQGFNDPREDWTKLQISMASK